MRSMRPRRCGSFRPGHEVHWIQALRPRRDALARGRADEVQDDGGFVLRLDGGGHIALWNHETKRLAALAADESVEYYEDQQLLVVPRTGGGWCFNVAVRAPHSYTAIERTRRTAAESHSV